MTIPYPVISIQACGGEEEPRRGEPGSKISKEQVSPWTMLPSCSEILWLSEMLGEAQDGASMGVGKSKQNRAAKETGLTWVGCIAGDTSALKLSGELPGKQYVGQLTVSICPQLLPPAQHWAV